jgi:hypothetical protein
LITELYSKIDKLKVGVDWLEKVPYAPAEQRGKLMAMIASLAETIGSPLSSSAKASTFFSAQLLRFDMVRRQVFLLSRQSSHSSMSGRELRHSDANFCYIKY